jgi:tetratricopeptide (TPR) repeat protein
MQIAKDLASKAKKKEWVPERYAADALAYSDGADYQQAVTWYKDVLTKTDDADVHIGLGDTYRKISGGGGEAMNNYEHVTEKDPKNSLAYSRIGDLWYEARNWQSVTTNYDKAKEADPNNPLPYRALSDVYSRSGKYQLALQNITKYLELSDKTLNDRVSYLEALYRAQSNCDAAKYSKEMLREQLSKDQKIEITGILGYSQIECGDSIEALNNLRTYFQIQSPDKIKGGDYLQLGKLYLKLGQLDSAGYFYTKGIAGDTAQNKTDIYRTIADAFKAKKDYCKSAEWYDNLVKSNPETQAGDYAWRSIMFYYCRNYARGVEASAEYFKKYPDQPSAPYWQARTAAAIDSEATTGTAVPFFQKWLEMPGEKKASDKKSAYEYMMYYYYHQKDKENLKMAMDKIREIDPTNKSVKEMEEAEKAPAPTKKAAAPPAKTKK